MRNKKFTIYLDMDGVITDFKGYFKYCFGIDYEELIKRDGNETNFINLINDAGPGFWENMFWLNSGIELNAYLRSRFEHICILSAPMGFDHVHIGKERWIRKYLGNQDYILSNDKWQYTCYNKDHILIDDREYNTVPWVNHGGRAILHDSEMVSNTIDKLEELLKE